MGKISAVFLARKKRSITFIVNYELRLSLYSNRVKGRGWNIYKFPVERKPAKRILWRHLKWRWKERKGRQETWLQLRPWDVITCNNSWRGKRSYGDNTFPDAKTGLQIISQLAPVKLSGQTYFCSDISHFGPDKHRLRLVAIKVPPPPFTWCLNMKQVNFQSI